MSIEAMKQALEALCNITNYEGLADARQTLRQAIAEAEKQEPKKIGTIGHIGDGKTTLTAAIAPLLTKYKIGQEVKVTRLTHGGAVYNHKREIINSHQPPHKTVCIGRIVEIEQECGNGAVVVKCESNDKFLPRFHFYPQDDGDNQVVEVLEQQKKSEKLTAFVEPVGEILLTNGDYKEVSWKRGKLPPVGSKLYTSPPQRQWVGLTDDEEDDILRLSTSMNMAIAKTEAKLKEKNT